MLRLRSSLAVLALAAPVLLGARGCDEPGDPGTCYCAELYAPVCGEDGATYGNACEADCAAVPIAHEGECETSCICADIYSPVCGSDANTYGNECEASCAGVMIAHAGPCECPAPPIWCEWGYEMDGRGCPSPECLPPPVCAAVLCDIYCEHGHVIDERGCDTCACNPPPAPSYCLADSECGVGAYCDTDECHSPCEGDGGGDGSDRACLAVCLGVCRAVPPPPAGCTSDSDCATGEQCQVPMCIWDDPSSPCPTEGYCVATRCDA